jgi:phosphoribosyl 1,2-cyclic phosphate phosphodiesterase
MKVKQRLTILGCSSSPGVPRIDGDWGACDPANPRNRRRRSSLLIEQIAEDGGVTTVVIDTGPDFREQMIDAGVRRLDAAVYSHPHADHIHGIDDLRGFALVQRKRMPVYADAETMQRLKEGFGYCFETPPGSGYPPIVEPTVIEVTDRPLVIEGEGGPLALTLFYQTHGDITSLGFRIGNVAYCCDVSGFPEEALQHLNRLDCLIIDALQYREHPSHFSLAQALDWVERLKPARAILTHMHIPLDYETVCLETPDHVEPAFDMMSIEQFVELQNSE